MEQKTEYIDLKGGLAARKVPFQCVACVKDGFMVFFLSINLNYYVKKQKG